MANPGYPMPMQQPPMGSGPMGPGPQVGGAAPPPRPVRRGTSKAVPVVVSAGLAVGVFCGLLFGLGTGEDVEASTSDKPAATAKADEPAKAKEPDKQAEPEKVAAKEPEKKEEPAAAPEKKDEPAAAAPEKKEEPAAAPAGGSAAPAAAAPAAAAPAAKVAKLTIDLAPADIADKAKITIDGKDVTDLTFEVALGEAAKKTVKVVVKASGYKDVTQNVDVEGDTKIQVELVKRRTGPATPPRPPTGGTNKKPGGGGLIDI